MQRSSTLTEVGAENISKPQVKGNFLAHPIQSLPRGLTADRVIAIVIALFAFGLVAALTNTHPSSWNDISRVAAIEARVEQQTWSLDNSPWAEITRDQVQFDDHSFSGKMPLLSGIGAVEYLLVHHFLGWSLAPYCASTNGCAYYWLSLTLVGLPFSLMLGLFYLWARTLTAWRAIPLLGTLAMGLGTEIFPYSLVLNHHVPAAIGSFVAFYLFTTYVPRNPRWLGVVGFAATFATMCDPLAGVFGVGLFVLTVVRYRTGALYFVLGALPPLLVTMWLDLQITGTILPPYVSLNGYKYLEAGDQRGLAGEGTPDDVPQYAFKMFLGAQGLFAYNPILFFALLGIGIVAFTRNAPLRAEAIVVGLSALTVALYLVFRTGNLGGIAYGERYYVNLIPTVMAFLAFAPPLFKTRARPVFGLVFAVALALSLVSSYQGAKATWLYVQPPAQLTRNSQTGAIGAKWNLW